MAKMVEKEKEKEKVDSGKVRIYSKRKGDIIVKGRLVIKFETFHFVDKDIADYLIKSYPEYIQKVD